MLISTMLILAILSTLNAVVCYFAKYDSEKQMFAQRAEAILFILLAILFILVAILFK